MNFGQALEVLKTGGFVRRAGWNGKNMHLFLEEDFQYLIPRRRAPAGPSRRYAACICIYNAQGITQPGWLASQADMLADDWEIVDMSDPARTDPC